MDLGTALSKRSSVVIFDIFNLHLSAGITNQSDVGCLLVTFLIKQMGITGNAFNSSKGGGEIGMRLSTVFAAVLEVTFFTWLR